MAGIQPYQFEPLARDEDNQPDVVVDWSSEDESSGGEADKTTAAGELLQVCQCGQCEEWEGQKKEEKRCCHYYPEVTSKLEEGQKCITSHEGAFVNCFSRYSTESIIVLMKRDVRRRWDEEFWDKEPHRTYRHVAYCNFVRWIWRTTGRKQRKVLPACLVATIRKKFPSAEYTGFKYAM